MIPVRQRVVIDTNVLVGAALSRGGGDNREVLRACLKGLVQPVLGMALFSEYEDLFLRSASMVKSPLNEKERIVLLESFLSVCEWVKVYYLWRPNLPDEADNHLIELALAGGLHHRHQQSSGCVPWRTDISFSEHLHTLAIPQNVLTL